MGRAALAAFVCNRGRRVECVASCCWLCLRAPLPPLLAGSAPRRPWDLGEMVRGLNNKPLRLNLGDIVCPDGPVPVATAPHAPRSRSRTVQLRNTAGGSQTHAKTRVGHGVGIDRVARVASRERVLPLLALSASHHAPERTLVYSKVQGHQDWIPGLPHARPPDLSWRSVNN